MEEDVKVREASEEWCERARREAASYKKGKVGSVINGGEFRATCRRESQELVINIQFTATDVPSDGNCLYYAVWRAAHAIGIVQPFGLRGVDHVFALRVTVAQRAVLLLRAGLIARTDIKDILKAGELIAQPMQWLQYSGVVPMMALSHLLGRTIVALAADGVTNVCPYDFQAFHGREDDEDPVVIYHCRSLNPHIAVDRRSRNHYTAVHLDQRNMEKLKQYLLRYRGRSDQVDGGSSTQQIVEAQREGIQHAQKRRKLNDQRVIEAHAATSSPMAYPVEFSPSEAKTNAIDVNGPGREEELLKSLERRALQLKDLNPEEMKVLARNFTRSPRLALVYYHCCSNDPRAFVHNNERLLGPGSTKTIDRLQRTLPKPVAQDQVAHSQVCASERGGEKLMLTACASCCEIIRSNKVAPVDFARLPETFRLTQEELDALKRYPERIIQGYVQVLEVEGAFYHLNPDLVPNPAHVHLCGSCTKDPRKTRFSIANGHDYGRPSALPALNDVASKCIAPARCFGLELSLNGKHSTGHAICFPSDGPVACSRVLPCTDVECLPRVTFIGPAEQWRVKKKKFRKLYSIDCEDVYQWLEVLQHTHSSYIDHQIVVDVSTERKRELEELEAYVERNVAFQGDDIAQECQDRMESERFGADLTDDVEDEIVMARSATLKPPESQPTTSHSVVVTMLNMLNQGGANVIPVQRDEEPVVEWTCNGKSIASVFPHLFMLGGARLPEGSWSTEFVKHLMNYYDGRFETSTALVALLFNQLQRHSAVRRAAKVGISHTTLLKRFGSLVNSQQFREELEQAKDNPKTPNARRLNASLLRVLSLVGGTVPFSPFERAATKPKIAAMRYRYGVPQHWVTVATPEHDDLVLHRIARLREENRWNDMEHKFGRAECTFQDLPLELQQSAKARLAVSSRFPVLSAEAFTSRFRVMIEDVMHTTMSSDTKLSRDFTQRRSGPYGHVAGHSSIIEVQVDGRLHSHSLVYGSTYTPQLLTRVACNPDLRLAAGQWLESVSSTCFSPETHDWMQALRATELKQPRAYEVSLPNAQEDLSAFLQACERRVAATNIHSHSVTCRKGRRGKYSCRLARPAGTHDDSTAPLIIARLSIGDLSKGVRPVMSGEVIDEESCAKIDDGYDIDCGHIFPQRLRGPLAWELRRPATDVNVVETNLTLAALTVSHTNSSIINGEDSGDSVEQYQQAYMTKDQAALNGAVPMLLSAVNYVASHPSKADDRDTDDRKGKFLATRAVNGFTGTHEWSHSLMAFALLGHRSFISNDIFWYIFPWALIKRYVTVSRKEPRSDEEPLIEDAAHEDSLNSVEGQLDDLVAMVNNDVDDTVSMPVNGSRGGTRSYRVNDQLVFVSQVESYTNRGSNFADFSPLEFECIVDVLPIKDRNEDHKSMAGRPRRPHFDFASTHPLYGHFAGFIRAKMPTAVFGGQPPPMWKEDIGGKKSNAATRCKFAQYAMCTFTAWKDGIPEFQCSEEGLLDLCRQWDHSEAALVHRQRYRYIRNLLQRGRRSSAFESVLTDWRNRSVYLWKDEPHSRVQKRTSSSTDPEFDGVIAINSDVYALIEMITSPNLSRQRALRAIQESLVSVVDNPIIHGSNQSVPYRLHSEHHGVSQRYFGGLLRSIAARVQLPQKHGTPNHPVSSSDQQGILGSEERMKESTYDGLSEEQALIVRHILAAVDHKGKPMQTRTMLHGAGGTGKSFVVRRICKEIEARGYKVVSTCPTGAGACQLNKGQTFHSAFKCMRKNELSVQAMEELRTIFDDRVVLVVVDEVSMFGVELLQQLNKRLRLIYGSDEDFGGKSILLVGDVSQLPVVGGQTLCKLMYPKTPQQALRQKAARILFSSFKVMFLRRQERARDCRIQQELLTAMRALPKKYPNAHEWRDTRETRFFPLTREVSRALTTPLRVEEVAQDPAWIESSVILVTNNQDRATMNAAMANILSKRNGVILFRWKKDIPEEVRAQIQQSEDLLYNEAERPVLFGYFFKGALGQVLDNGNGNVGRGVANGTLCRYHSLAWDDDVKTKTVLELVAAAIERKETAVDLPFHPDFINVSLMTREGEPIPASAWPQSDQVDETEGVVVIPMGIITSKPDAYHLKIGGEDRLKLYYTQHAVDLAMAMTVWKAQGATFTRVLLLLETSDMPFWNFEHLYVALSRVRSTQHIRCIPLSFAFNYGTLLKLRPNIYTVRWRMDLDNNGFWKERTVV